MIAMSTLAQSKPAQGAPKTSPAPRRNAALDFLKLVLAFMIVALHSGFLEDVSASLAYLTIDGIFRIAVPIFLVINGFYFFPVLQQKGAKKWFVRVICLYLFWTFVYAYFWMPTLSLSASGLAKTFRTLAIGYFHLWYLSGMIGAGLLVLMFQKIRKEAVLLVALVFYVIGVLIQYAGNYHVFANRNIDYICNIVWMHRNFVFLSFPFFYIGYFIHASGLHEKFTLRQLVFAGFLGTGLLLLESYTNFTTPGSEGAFDNYLTLLLACPLIFMAVQKMKVYVVGSQVAMYSSGIYFVHIFVLLTLRPYLNIGQTGLTFVVLIISIAIASVLIPLSRKFRFIL